MFGLNAIISMKYIYSGYESFYSVGNTQREHPTLNTPLRGQKPIKN